ncbi:preprotein translocase subunit SecE [Cellulosilyticum sp. ST5]|uniref:Protein translocase subunit SecE n=1 Tax=Cellulosilyticum lentocellum (strain ATCC 49066 / DSM 5427 / NCIMB 11756 / RHM5) TaxID=642492 RepID=F2JT31_CELLD|nr:MULTISPECIES: preprotein translocase subunit SecE [Cellulosilyticum]ADZ85250.1 preprotein translocase, SecE subunit [Cellulosilyticum lentocellum DSM 5427]QEH70818.1 preprotein translocase subunit SecE [Cellulosilyticum sp. WCF-2]
MIGFFKDFIAESKRVVWPNKEELTKLTLNVLGLSIIVAIIIYIMDFAINGGIGVLENLIKGLL